MIRVTFSSEDITSNNNTIAMIYTFLVVVVGLVITLAPVLLPALLNVLRSEEYGTGKIKQVLHWPKENPTHVSTVDPSSP